MIEKRPILHLPKKQKITSPSVICDVAEIEATITYDPYRPGIKKNNRSNMIVAELDFGFSEYYQYLLKRGTGKLIQGNAWKPHVTIFDGKKKLQKDDIWGKYNNQKIRIKYSVNIEKHWKFWVLPVIDCGFLQQIREEHGCYGKHPFHITIGRDFE